MTALKKTVTKKKKKTQPFNLKRSEEYPFALASANDFYFNVKRAISDSPTSCRYRLMITLANTS